MFVRSTVAYGTVQSVDVSEAESMPGVIAVYHAGNSLGFSPFQSFPMIAETFNRPVFAGETVRFVGDIVAAVVAETRAQAVDAMEAVVVDIDPLQAIVDGPTHSRLARRSCSRGRAPTCVSPRASAKTTRSKAPTRWPRSRW